MEHLDPAAPSSKIGASRDVGAMLVNYYQVLDVEPESSRLEIREAYLRLKSTYDAGSTVLYSLISDDEAREQLTLIEEAFRVLSDETLRRAFNVRLAQAEEQDTRMARQGAVQQDSLQDLAFAPERLLAMLGDDDESPSAELLGTRESSWPQERVAERVPPAAVNMHDARQQDAQASRLATSERMAFSDAPGPSRDWLPGAGEDPSGQWRSTRANLPMIKLKANGAGAEVIKEQMLALIAGSDPGDGDLFRRLRELCDVSEDEMQERTKVSVASLRAIEANRFEKLPQAVYVKGFLRSYFRYICAPEAEVMAAAFTARLMDWQASRKS